MHKTIHSYYFFNCARLTKIADFGFYKFFDMLHEISLKNKTAISEELARNYTSVDAAKVQTQAIHGGEDFIHSCSWAGKDCRSKLNLVYTDFGICHSFNVNKTIKVSESGRASSLSLMLNIEQYEHMPGPDTGAGVLIFLHDNHIRPLVSDLGFVVPSGMHTLIGVKRDRKSVV